MEILNEELLQQSTIMQMQKKIIDGGGSSNNIVPERFASRADVSVISPQQHGNKRSHATTSRKTSGIASTESEAKRLKSTKITADNNNVVECVRSKPRTQLLQQLMSAGPTAATTIITTTAPKPTTTATSQVLQQTKQQQQQQQQQLPKYNVQQSLPLQNAENLKQQQQQQQQTNSVLKNLLISGCDVSAGYCIISIPSKKPAITKAKTITTPTTTTTANNSKGSKVVLA